MTPELHDNDTMGRRVARATLITRSFIVVATALGLAVLGVLVYSLTLLLDLAGDTNRVVIGVEKQQDTNTGVVKSIQDLALSIRSCTDPEGECAKRGDAKTAAAVGNIKADTRDVVIATLVCQQQGVQGFGPIARCVDLAVAEAAAARPSQRKP